MPAKTTSGPSASSRFELFGAVVCAAVAVVFFYRYFFLSGFDKIAGDIGDARLYIALLEHWRAVFLGKAAFANPNFFFPARDVLGYSDGVFLYAPAYFLFRLVGLDSYLAFELLLILLRLIGFAGLYLLLRRKLKLDLMPSLVGAILFSISHIYYTSVSHPQLAVVAFVPWLVILLIRYFENFRRLSLWTAAALFALMFFTGYYISFFCVLAGFLFAIAWLIYQVATDRRGLVLAISEHGRRAVIDSVVAIAIFGVCLTPFLAVYLPSLHSTGGRSYAETLAFIHSFRDLFNVSGGNLIWGGLVRYFYSAHMYQTGETSRGFAPFGVLLAAFAFCWALRPANRSALRGWTILTGIVCVGLYAVSVFFLRWSLWWFVFEFVPGGSAIRAPNRINHVIALGIAVLSAIALQYILDQAKRISAIPRPIASICITALALFLLVEQVDVESNHAIDRPTEVAYFKTIPNPPGYCSAFFGVNPRKNPLPNLAPQLDAMLIARQHDIPTLNGYSGWYPPDWSLGAMTAANIGTRTRAYARKHRIDSKLCSLDLQQGVWLPVSVDRRINYRLGSKIDFTQQGSGEDYEGEGWTLPGNKGTCMASPSAKLVTIPDRQPPEGLNLSVDFAALPENIGAIDVLVNGSPAAHWLGGTPGKRTASIPISMLPADESTIEFQLRDIKPQDESAGPGSGVCIRSLTLDAVPAGS